MPGRASGGAAVARLMGLDTVQRRSGDLEGRARRFYTDVLSQLRPPSRVCPVVEAYPSSPATFPCTSMISLPELLEPWASACAPSHPADFAPSACRPRFFDRAFSDPLCAALRHVSGATSTGPLAQELTHLAGLGAPVRFFDDPHLYDGLNRRRSGLSTTSGSAGAAALRLASPVPGEVLPFSLAVPIGSFSLPSPYSNSLRARVSRTLAGQ